MITATNCSIGRTTYLEGLDAAPTTKVELWWPFAYPDPSDEEIDRVVAELERRNKQLIALNMFGGDLAAGDRGILHEQDMPAAHLDAIERFHEKTGVRRFNLLLGRGGTQLTADQERRFNLVARDVDKRFGGVAMVEPISATPDYPVTTVEHARPLLEHGGLLLDLYHLAVNDAVELSITPEHVQVADNPGRGAPGTGSLPLQDWIDQLHAQGYAGEVAGEWLP
ncbi:MAG: TIM barrel protein [Corynebacterium sp.]|uniref:TIM barrel protein n=1 Tax=Corynebacterium sp. TaxID=1720 RepID=UPI0026E09DF7|nr:TIM barrel protein [Corynebacterium sp.]MDO5668974.1 TIM barrel protein [Corynebacterium sp.]